MTGASRGGGVPAADVAATTGARGSVFSRGDRVRVTEECVWLERQGKVGTVTAVSVEYGTVHVKLDDEDVFFADGGTASFEATSLAKEPA